MNKLIVADAAAGFRIQANDAVGEKVVTVTVTAVVITRWCFDRKINVAQFEIGAHRRPNRSVSGVLPGIVFPRVVAELAALGNRVKCPEQLAAADVISAHKSRHVGF
jgi:hypothetical protein